MARLRFRVQRGALAQPHAHPAAILGDELDARRLERGDDLRGRVGASAKLAVLRFEALDSWRGNLRRRKVRLRRRGVLCDRARSSMLAGRELLTPMRGRSLAVIRWIFDEFRSVYLNHLILLARRSGQRCEHFSD